MTDRNWSKTTLYKYRKFDSRTLSMLINKELYFASPEDLNDPYDCQISISKSIEEAIAIAKKRHPGALTLEKINLLAKLTACAPKMETNIKSTGIYSLSRTSTNVLMWTHYSGDHRGLCIGIRLPDCMLTYDSQAKIVGTNICGYFANNPFVNYLNKIVTANEIMEWNHFWFRVFGIGLVAKHNSWKYEKEVRIVRKEPGIVAIGPQNIVEIIFGVNMPIENMKTVTKLLSGEEWAHIKYCKMTKYSESFRLMKKEMSRVEIDHIRAGRFEMV